jgi:hypothetical protein
MLAMHYSINKIFHCMLGKLTMQEKLSKWRIIDSTTID